MKTLYLLRHAKSSWSDPDLRDFERPLSARGLADVERMAARFRASGRRLDCIVSSPAVRAKTTAQLFAEGIGYTAAPIVSNPELYFAGAAMFLKAVRLVDDEVAAALLVGHNPAITEFLNVLCQSDIENIPTCGLAQVTLPNDHWADVQLGNGRLTSFEYPKQDRED